ncbi:helix-turn-helix domain-containing protein [Bacillus cytotoxicus]|uniref:Helix-turn-helix domain-containing protein n=1 Tax=Bacillus cytotoxicus TaxID=580165 RepID=A0ACC6A336_9BACI|nr:helix-turn-helix domain-containing protein [Bacillus cytotoxicus]
MLLNQKYEIFPTEAQKEVLDRWLQYCRQTYNSALLDKERKYKQNKENYDRYDMQRQLILDKKGLFTKYVFIFHTYHFLFTMSNDKVEIGI